MNKSEIARNFWRKVFDENKIDLRNSDARKAAVQQFLGENKKEGWKAADRRFFRLGFEKVAKEKGFNVASIGLTPTPSKTKKQIGSVGMNITSKEKQIHPLFTKEPEKPEDKAGNPKQDIPRQQQITGQEEAAYYSAQSVAAIFDTMFNIFCSRYPMCSPLSNQEKIALGEAWSPMFNEYFSTQNKFIVPVVITAPIILTRFAQFSAYKKEQEVREKYNINEPEEKKESRTWGEKLGKTEKK